MPATPPPSAAEVPLAAATWWPQVQIGGAWRDPELGGTLPLLNPSELDEPDVGPLLSARQRALAEDFLAQAHDDRLPVAARAGIDHVPAGGFYLSPTLLADVPAPHRLAQQEIFGPVQVLTPFDDEAEALRLAHRTPHGRVAGVWTRDGSRQMRLARAWRCGQVFIHHDGAGGIELPFGGVRRSGHGREEGFEALYGFSTLKTVAMLHG